MHHSIYASIIFVSVRIRIYSYIFILFIFVFVLFIFVSIHHSIYASLYSRAPVANAVEAHEVRHEIGPATDNNINNNIINNTNNYYIIIVIVIMLVNIKYSLML